MRWRVLLLGALGGALACSPSPLRTGWETRGSGFPI